MIKKTLLSTAAVALLATAGYAGTLGMKTGAAAEYNTVFVSAMGTAQPIGAVVKNIELNTTSTINNKNVVYFKLNGGTWAGTPTNYKLTYDNNTTGSTQTLAAASVSTANELQFIITGSIANDKNMTVGYNSGTDLNITIPATASGAVTIESRAHDNENNIALSGASTATALTIANSITVTPTASVTCVDVVIDNTDKTRFVTGGTTTPTTATCALAIVKPSAVATTLDWSYSDVNATITMTNGNLNDGNFTAATVAGTTAGVVSLEQALNFYVDKDLTDDINSTLKYTLSGNGSLTDTQFKSTVVLAYVLNGNKTQTPVNAVNSMKWTLPVYSATVVNMRSNTANGTDTFIKLFNNDSALVASVDVTVTTADGRAIPTLAAYTTVPAKGSATISASAINAAITSEDLANGYTVVVGYSNIAKTLGNAVTTQRNADKSTYNMRTVDNSTITKGL